MNEQTFKKNRQFIIGIILTIIEGVLSGSIFIAIIVPINMLLKGQPSMHGLLMFTLFLVGLFVARFIIYATGYTMSQIGGAAVSKQVRLNLADKLKKIPLSRFSKGEVGQYVNVMTSDVMGYQQILTHKVGNLIKNISLLTAMSIFITTLYLPAGLVLLISYFLLIPELYLSFQVVKKYGAGKNKTSQETVSAVVEYITGIQTFRAYGAAGMKNRKTTDSMAKFSETCYQYEAHGIPVTFIFNVIHWLTIPAIMMIALNPWTRGELNSAQYLLLCLLPMIMAKLVASVSMDLFTYKNYMISKNNISRLLNAQEEYGKEKTLSVKDWSVKFENVTFSYNLGEPVLKNISFCANAQKLTAIVGDSGSGKSTIMNLIAKYYEPEHGRIRIGNKEINELMADQVLKQVSLVDQDVFLFNDTIKENIRCARKDAKNEEIIAALQQANCEAFISRLEKGIDTEIGENGALLSGGERQRLSIARAILKDAPIILLDEATASLDIENELAVREAIVNLLKAKKTVIIIAHTMSVIKDADEIIVVGNGEIKEKGSHNDLLKNHGKYYDMWKAEPC